MQRLIVISGPTVQFSVAVRGFVSRLRCEFSFCNDPIWNLTAGSESSDASILKENVLVGGT